jgi:hypothetical protein
MGVLMSLRWQGHAICFVPHIIPRRSSVFLSDRGKMEETVLNGNNFIKKHVRKAKCLNISLHKTATESAKGGGRGN